MYLRPHRIGPMAGALALALLTAGCGAGGPASAGPGAGGRLRVVASFYPLQYIAGRIGGDRAEVTGLTKPGAEPHDLELTPQDVADVQNADLVVYLSGFQPAVDDAVSAQGPPTVFDAAPSAHLDLTYASAEAGHTGATRDPHFWLDPTRLASVASALATTMARADPQAAGTFRANASALDADLEALDADFRAGLSTCVNRDVVTSHNAFGYLAERYGLKQIGITGLTPEAEPDPGTLAAVTRFVESHHVRTIYYETLVSPAIAETVARESGVHSAVLDPLEGLNEHSDGKNYLQVMRANLAALRAGQPCP